MHFDWPLDQLRDYDPALAVPATSTGSGRRRWPGCGPDASFTPVDTGLVAVETYDVTFAGFGGDPVRAWLHLPAAALRSGPLPGVVQFQGYNGGRGLAHEHVFWATAGYAHLVVDTRGQGSGWTTGATGDPGGSGPAQPGFLTRGIEDPHTYYYRRVYADAVAARRGAARARPRRPDRVAVAGGSQGGGIATSVAALAPSSVAALLPRRTVPLRLPRARPRSRSRPVPRAGALPRRAPGPGRADVRDAGLLRRRGAGPAAPPPRRCSRSR